MVAQIEHTRRPVTSFSHFKRRWNYRVTTACETASPNWMRAIYDYLNRRESGSGFFRLLNVIPGYNSFKSMMFWLGNTDSKKRARNKFLTAMACDVGIVGIAIFALVAMQM